MKFLFLILALSTSAAVCQHRHEDVRTLIVVFDGLRPDYITPALMPHLYSLRQKGSYVPDNHSVFPTVTRVNASSYVTGSYPGTHGLMGNTVYFPEVDSARGLNTGDATELARISAATDNQLLTTVSLGSILKENGSGMMVFSSGSSGQAFLQNHTVSGGAVVHPELILPATLKEDVYKNIGAPPESDKPNIRQHDWAARAFLHYGTAADGPLVCALWFSDPDGTAHEEGIGSPMAIKSIQAVDEQLGNIISVLESRDLLSSYNIIVTADHGFVTRKGKVGLQEFLVKQGLKKDASSDDVILAGGALYVKGHNRDLIRRIVSALHEQPWIGAIFTRSAGGKSRRGWVPGTLSFDVIHWDHERAADILVDYNWDDEANAHGYKGSSFATGVAGHGGSSPYEITIPLIASGPAFKLGYQSPFPTSNTDIVPTILHYYGIPVPDSMDGRVMDELLIHSPVAKYLVVKKEPLQTLAEYSWGTYRLTLERSIMGEQQYVDFTRVERKRKDEK